MLGLSDPSILGLLVDPHLKAARTRDAMLSMMNINSPNASDPDSSDDEIQEEEDRVPRPRWSRVSGGGADVDAAPASARPQAMQQRQQPQQPQRIQFRKSDAKAGGAAFVFEREEPPQATTGESALTALLGQRGGGAGGGGAAAAPSGPPTTIKVYGTPSGTMTLEVPEDSSMLQVIRHVLSKAGSDPGTSSAYELLTADEDGDPEFTVDRDKPVSDFGNEYAMRKASAKVAAAQEAAEAVAAAPTGGAGQAAQSSPRRMVMRVHLPREAFGQRLGQWVIKQPYRGEMALADVMNEVCRLQRVRLHPNRHVFVKDGSAEPLDMSARLREIELPLTASGEPEIRVMPRPYADQTPSRPAGAHGGMGARGADGSGGEGLAGRGGGSEAKGGTIDMVFSNASAILYKEYNVTKLNRRGVRQQRVVGIDNHKFRNLAPANARDDNLGHSSFRDGALKWFGIRQQDTGAPTLSCALAETPRQ
jgi:hypothetical protein